MLCELISVGDELLIGQVVNTNSSWMAAELNMIGIGVHRITAIADTKDHVKQALDDAFRQVDIVIMTGGLGPTKDDITKTALAEYFEVELVLHEPTLQHIEIFFHKRGRMLTALNRKQAEIPSNCEPLFNPNGTAPGMWFEKDGKILVSLPGVPFEMKALMTHYILPRLASMRDGDVIIHKTVLTQGVGESFLADIIAPWEDALPPHIRLAYLPQPGIVRLRLSATGNNRLLLQEQLQEQVDELLRIIPELVFGFDNDTLESVVGQMLRSGGVTLGTAESCTGGYLAHLITSIPGSSDYFKGSIIAYSNELKTDLLGVSSQLLETHGAVSKEVAQQMAVGARNLLGCDYALATSGIAGPAGGTPEKPVGTVWIALATPTGTTSQVFQLGDKRDRNIRRSALSALNMLRVALKT
ncbi:MAG: competence/damage-inducible protein A [Bacteroidales bacterium]|nr:competence/damage-inducible protein A [Bacteroidales bacterium]MDZ4204816.1 competence/damage-inducible protein A [Bacteroidales bacterium]